MPLVEVAALSMKAAEIGIVVHGFNLCLAAVKQLESVDCPEQEPVTLTTKSLTVAEAFLLLWLDLESGEVGYKLCDSRATKDNANAGLDKL